MMIRKKKKKLRNSRSNKTLTSRLTHSTYSAKNIFDDNSNQIAANTPEGNISYSIPKSSRFKPLQRESVGRSYNLRSTLSQKTTKFPLSKRNGFFIKKSKKEVERLPGPGKYKQTHELIYKFIENKGYSFQKRKRLRIEPRNVPVGPGTYSVTPKFGKDGIKSTLSGRLKMFNDQRVETSPGIIYSPNHSLVYRNRYGTGASLGYGKRLDFTKNQSSSPGPIYKLPSIFDKYNKK